MASSGGIRVLIRVLALSALILLDGRAGAAFDQAAQEAAGSPVQVGAFRFRLPAGWERAPAESEKELGAWAFGDAASADPSGRTLVVSFGFEATSVSSEAEKTALLNKVMKDIVAAHPRNAMTRTARLAGAECMQIGFVDADGRRTFYLMPSFDLKVFMITVIAMDDNPRFPARAQELLDSLEFGPPRPVPAKPAPVESRRGAPDPTAKKAEPDLKVADPAVKSAGETLTAAGDDEILTDENAVLDSVFEKPFAKIFPGNETIAPEVRALPGNAAEWLASDEGAVPSAALDKTQTGALADPCPSLPLPDKIPDLGAAPSPPQSLILELSKSINRLGRTQYQGVVSAAMEASRLLVGPLSPADEKRFLQAWAPAFTYTSDRLMSYFERLNPLLVEFLGLVEASQAALAQMDQIRYEAEMASAYENEPAAREAMADAGRCATELRSLKDRIADVAGKAAALGPPPDPRIDLCDTRRRTKKQLEAPEGAAPAGPAAAGSLLDWLARSGVAELSFQASFPAQRPGNPSPFTDERWIRRGEITADGRTFRFSSEDDYYGDGHCADRKNRLRPAMRFEIEGDITADESSLERLTFKVIFDNCTMVQKPGIQIPYRGLDYQMSEEEREKYYNFVPKRSERTIVFEYIPFMRRAAAKRPDAEGASFTFGLKGPEVLSRILSFSDGTPAKASTPQDAIEVTLVLLPGAAAPEAKPKPAPDPTPEKIAFHEENIRLLTEDLNRLQAMLSKAQDKDSRDFLQYQITCKMADLQGEKDAITTLQTGQFTRTPTSWDAMVRVQMLVQGRASAAELGSKLSLRSRLDRMLSYLPPEKRNEARRAAEAMIDGPGDRMANMRRALGGVSEQARDYQKGLAAKEMLAAAKANETVEQLRRRS